MTEEEMVERAATRFKELSLLGKTERVRLTEESHAKIAATQTDGVLEIAETINLAAMAAAGAFSAATHLIRGRKLNTLPMRIFQGWMKEYSYYKRISDEQRFEKIDAVNDSLNNLSPVPTQRYVDEYLIYAGIALAKTWDTIRLADQMEDSN